MLTDKEKKSQSPVPHSMKTEKKECHNFCLDIDSSIMHAPIFMPPTLLVVPFHWHAPVSMLQDACSCLKVSLFIQIYYPLTENETTNLSPVHNFMQIEKN